MSWSKSINKTKTKSGSKCKSGKRKRKSQSKTKNNVIENMNSQFLNKIKCMSNNKELESSAPLRGASF